MQLRHLVKILWGALCVVILLAPLAAAMVGKALGPGILHPANLNPNRITEVKAMLVRTDARKVDFDVEAKDGAILQEIGRASCRERV